MTTSIEEPPLQLVSANHIGPPAAEPCIRAGIIEANPELQERELIKLQNLAGAIKAALVERGVSANAAILAAQTGVTVFHVAFAHWVEQDDPTAFRRLIDESLEELRSVTAA